MDTLLQKLETLAEKNKEDIESALNDENDIKYHNLSFSELKKIFKTNLDTGLTEKEAAERLRENGLNTLKDIKESGYKMFLIVTKFIHWLPFFTVTILIFTFLDIFLFPIILSEYYDSKSVYMGIFTVYIVFVITPDLFEGPMTTDVVKIFKSNYLTPEATGVIRDGTVNVIDSTKLVPGDLVILEKDDIVPADIRLIFCSNLQTRRPNCSEVIKHVIDVPSDSVQPHKNIVCYGHKVEGGSGMGVIIATGLNTQIGEVCDMIYKMEEPSPKWEYLKGFMIFFCMLLFVVVFCVGFALLFDKLMIAFFKLIPARFDENEEGEDANVN